MSFSQLGTDIIRHIAILASDISYSKPNCNCFKNSTNILPFAYTCKYVYYSLVTFPLLWHNLSVGIHSMAPNDPRTKYVHAIKYLKENADEQDISIFPNCRKIITFININLIISPQILSQLEQLYIILCIEYQPVGLWDYIGQMVNLKKLAICDGSNILDLKPLKNLTKLTSLKIFNCILDKENVDFFKSFPLLEHLVFPGSGLYITKEILQCLPRLRYAMVHYDLPITNFYNHPSIEHIAYASVNTSYFIYHKYFNPVTFTLDLAEISYITEDMNEIKKNIPTLQMIQQSKDAWITDVKYRKDMTPLKETLAIKRFSDSDEE
jgi:hypothetical protein